MDGPAPAALSLRKVLPHSLNVRVKLFLLRGANHHCQSSESKSRRADTGQKGDNGQDEGLGATGFDDPEANTDPAEKMFRKT